jgi:hypothetical protein
MTVDKMIVCTMTVDKMTLDKMAENKVQGLLPPMADYDR